MKKLKAFFLVCVLAGITSCYCDDCNNPDDKIPIYVNTSGQNIKIVAIVKDCLTDLESTNKSSKAYEKSIADNDTLRRYIEYIGGYNYKEDEEWQIPLLQDYGLVDCPFAYRIPVIMELRFLDESEKCLIFEGPIKDDGIDMRSFKSYKRGAELYSWADFWAGVEYIYTITKKHKDMAKEKYCDAPVFE